MERYRDILSDNINCNCTKGASKMKIRMRRNRDSILFNGFNCAIARDKNGLFAIRRCMRHLCRLLSFVPVLDVETWDFIQWLVPEENERIFTMVADALDEIRTDMWMDEINDCRKFPERYPHSLSVVTTQIPQWMVDAIVSQLLPMLEQKERELRYAGASDFEKGMASLKKMFHLTDDEVDLCWLFFITDKWRNARYFFINHLDIFGFSARHHLQAVLAMDHRRFSDILRGSLQKIGALAYSDDMSLCLSVEFLSDLEFPASGNLTKGLYTRIPAKTIPLTCHQFGRNETEHILRLLQQKTKSSTHILLYGRPGTGKTTFAYGLAHRLNLPAYRVAQPEENESIKRRMAIVACRNMTASGNGALIMVDEADNILNTRLSGFKRGETQDKGWLNQFLEEPGARMIWITNTIDDIEESVLRRFAYSVHFEDLNRRQRVRLWQGILENHRAERFFSLPDIEKMVTYSHASAGVIDLAVRKAKEMKIRSRETFQQSVLLALDAHEQLLAGGERNPPKERIESSYSLEGLNVQGDITSLIQDIETFDGIIRQPGRTDIRNMNLLFYGPPGTGKSELARFIGDRLQRDVICKRAGDIMDCLVGNTEKNIKRSFDEAEREQAVLVFDEAETFLVNREMARHSWEISFTNEFLTRMERYHGILVCTTNRMTELDSASIRRFNYKIGLNYLTSEGNVIFFRKLLAALTPKNLRPEDASRLKSLIHLTPGDFRIVRDRFAVMAPDRISPQAMIDALHDEARIKEVHRGEKSIGFMP
jgi:SpoVK/Ycf46/Vps4 family AAA+-type ATPase